LFPFFLDAELSVRMVLRTEQRTRKVSCPVPLVHRHTVGWKWQCVVQSSEMDIYSEESAAFL